LINNYKSYATKFAFLFSVISALFFSAILYQYALLLGATEEAKTSSELSAQAKKIEGEMDRYDPSVDKVFYFPRYKTYKAGLYDASMRPVFTTIDGLSPSPKEGYGRFKNKRFFVYKLPEGIYFGAAFLVVSKEFSDSEVYLPIVSMLLIATCLAFVVFMLLIKEFQKPFVEINQSLDNFIKDSMHEINTPLSIIVTNIELSEAKHGDNKYLNRIKAAAKTLSTLYDDMDYIVKAEQNNFPKERIDLSELLAHRVDYFSEIAAMKNIRITLDACPECNVYMNRSKLLRVIDNNISNAVKYSKEDSVVEISAIKHDGKIELSFKDYGVGIKQPEKIFDRYYREEKAKGGFGLGLNIVKNICDDEGIEIRLTSEYGKGSEFKYLIVQC